MEGKTIRYHLLALGVVASLLCFIVWNLVIDKLGNITSTNYVYLNPVFTLITAAILLGVIWAGRK